MTKHVTKELNSITINNASKLLFKETKLLIYLDRVRKLEKENWIETKNIT